MTDLYKWSTTPGDNDDADADINWAEGQNPDTVNNSARQVMARVAEFRDDINASRASTGTGNAYIVSAVGPPQDFTKPFLVSFVADKTNTDAATLTVGSLATKPLRAKSATNLAPNEVQAGTLITAMYYPTGDEYLLHGHGYHVSARTLDIVNAYSTGNKVGDVVITLDTSPRTGRIRLGESAQTFDPVTYPELSQWLTGLGSPWGANTLPAAAGYFLRFGSTTSTIDTAGPRTAGLTQTDQNKAHDHGGATGSNGAKSIPITTAVRLQGTGTGESYTVPGGSTATADDHTHTISSDGGDEVRTKNVTMHADIIASASQSNIDVYAVNGLALIFDSGTSAADPGSGRIRFNNATLASATTFYVSESGYFGEAIADLIGSWSSGSRFRFYKVGAPANYIEVTSTATPTDSGDYRTVTFTYVGGAGSFGNGDPLGLQVTPPGAAGPAGAGLDWQGAWVTSTTYAVGDGVSNGGQSYIATSAHTSAAATEPGVGASWATVWDLVAQKGADGVTLNWQGTWATSTSYALNDAVENDGSSYIATSAHTSAAATEPGTGASWATVWDLIAQKGADGAGSVSSVFGRSGAVVAANSDYDITQIDFSASDRIAGRATSGAGLAEELTAAQVRTIINVEDGATADQTGAEIESALDTELGSTDWKSSAATDANVRSAATGNTHVQPSQIESASALVTLTDAATVAVDWDVFINGELTLGGNRTLGNPTNGQPGTWRQIIVNQDVTGTRTLSFAANYKFVGGTAPTLSTGASEKDVLNIFCETASVFHVYSALGMS